MTRPTDARAAVHPVADGWRDRATRWLEIRPGEWGLTLLLTLSAFASITAYYFLKPASKSIFLAAYGAKGLPDGYIATAIVTGIIGTAYAHFSRRMPLAPLLNGVLLLLAGLIAAFRFGFDITGEGWLAWAFFIFVSAFGVLAPAMLWFSMNHILEPRQARRLLGYIGTGAIGGGIAGGYLARFMLDFVSERDLLWGAEAFFLLSIVTLDIALWRTPTRIRDRPGARVETAGTFKLIVSHRYVRLLTVLIAIIMTCASLAEYQFLWAVDAYVPAGKETAKYIATWYSHLNLICLPIQLIVTAPMLRRFGVGPALLVLPTAVFAIATGMAAAPILAFGTAMKVGESALRYSVNKSGVELLYLPLPHWIKDRSKVFIDTVVDRSAKGAAGVLLKVLHALGVGIQGVSMVTASLAILWFGLSIVMRRRYVSAFREALDRGAADFDTHAIRLDELHALTAVEAHLGDVAKPVALRTLDMLLASPDAKTARFDARLGELALSEDPEVAWRCLALGAREPGRAVMRAAETRVTDPDPRVATAAAQVLLASRPVSASDFLESVVSRVPGGEAIAAAALFGAGQDVPDELVERLLRETSDAATNARRMLATALSNGQLAQRRALLRRLMADPDPGVAIAAIRGAGSLHDPDLVPFLLTTIRHPSRRKAAREGLVRMGAPILPTLEAHLADPKVEDAIRARIPRVIGTIGGIDAHQMLLRALTIDDPLLRQQVLKALNRMARDRPGYHLPDAVIESELVGECHYLATLLALAAETGGGGRVRPLFERALADSIRHARERAFRVLGLRGAGRDWANAFAGLVGNDARLRASAVEFADGTLPDRLRRVVVPLIDDIGASEALHRVGRHLQVEHLGREQSYVRAASSREPWLAACALAAGAEEGLAAVLEVARERSEDRHPWVRSAAALALKMGGGSAPLEDRAPGHEPERGPMNIDTRTPETLTHVERVLVLAAVPLFAEARTSDLADLAAVMHERRLANGEVVQRAGEAPDAMHVLISGRIRFERSGRPPVESTTGAFGAFALFDAQPRSWTATAVGPTRILTIEREAFVEVISDHVNVARGLLRIMAGRLRDKVNADGGAGSPEDVEIG